MRLGGVKLSEREGELELVAPPTPPYVRFSLHVAVTCLVLIALPLPRWLLFLKYLGLVVTFFAELAFLASLADRRARRAVFVGYRELRVGAAGDGSRAHPDRTLRLDGRLVPARGARAVITHVPATTKIPAHDTLYLVTDAAAIEVADRGELADLRPLGARLARALGGRPEVTVHTTADGAAPWIAIIGAFALVVLLGFALGLPRAEARLVVGAHFAGLLVVAWWYTAAQRARLRRLAAELRAL